VRGDWVAKSRMPVSKKGATVFEANACRNYNFALSLVDVAVHAFRLGSARMFKSSLCMYYFDRCWPFAIVSDQTRASRTTPPARARRSRLI